MFKNTKKTALLMKLVSMALLIALVAGIFSIPVGAAPNAEADKTITSNSTGTHNGYFYTFWQEASGGSMTLGANGNYSLTWTTGANNIVVGKGWNPGSNHTVSYTGSWNCGGNCYVALYGWTTDPLIEYYVVEDFGNYNPSSGATLLNSITTDGSIYDIYRTQRVDKPSIIGNATFYQFWSVRRDQRTSGTITTANHFNAWTASGLTLGTHNYQVLATEGYQSSGSSNFTVTSGAGPTATPTPVGTLLTHVETESMTRSGGNSITSPFTGVVLYSNGNNVSTTYNFPSSGSYRIDVSGNSTSSSAADVDVYIGGVNKGRLAWSGTTVSTQSLWFTANAGSQEIRLQIINDVGQSDANLDWFELRSSSGGAGPTATRTPTTGGPTATRTRTPTTGGPTATRTRTPTTGGPTATRTRTLTPSPGVTNTPTPTSGSGGTCSPVTATITSPFTKDGAGAFCWQASTLGSYLNSWNLASLSVNGTNYTNIWVAVSSLPAKIGGFWYISYNSSVAWGHFEAK